MSVVSVEIVTDFMICYNMTKMGGMKCEKHRPNDRTLWDAVWDNNRVRSNICEWSGL